MRIPLTAWLLVLAILAQAQPLPNRYRAEVFDNSVVVSEVLYSENVPQPLPGGGFYEWLTGLPLKANEAETEPVDLYMDIYSPAGDTLTNRPAVVVCFGGGFLSGSKDHWSIVLLAEALARRGFVAATIDYRLGMNIFDQDLAARAVYRGLQDGRAAVKYLRSNAESYGISPEEIYIGGHSSGAFIALHNLYLDTEDERPLSTFEWTQEGEVIPDLGCLDCTGIDSELTGHAASAFNLAGAVGFLSYIETDLDGRTVSFHSQDDGTVPYDSGEPFSDVSGLVFGSDLPIVFGSHQVSLRCDTVGLPDSLLSYTNRGHGVHEAPGDTLYADIIPAIGEWFYNNRLEPEANQIHGDSLICADDIAMPYSYSVPAGDAVWFDWHVIGADSVISSPYDSVVTVIWSDTATSRAVSVTPYNAFLARGATQVISIAIGSFQNNAWIGVSGLWTDPSNWSLGHVPNKCETVTIQNMGTPILVDVESGNSVRAREISVIGAVELNFASGSIVKIKL